jgi:hypothetical protein
LASVVERVWRAIVKYGVVAVQPQILQIAVPMLQAIPRHELYTDAGLAPPVAPGAS